MRHAASLLVPAAALRRAPSWCRTRYRNHQPGISEGHSTALPTYRTKHTALQGTLFSQPNGRVPVYPYICMDLQFLVPFQSPDPYGLNQYCNPFVRPCAQRRAAQLPAGAWAGSTTLLSTTVATSRPVHDATHYVAIAWLS